MSDPIILFWRGEKIGELRNAIPDMWYLEGEWVPEINDVAKEFERIVSDFDAKKVCNDPKKGTRVVMIYEPEMQVEMGTDALVISLNENRLFVRRVLEKEAIKWLKRNVNDGTRTQSNLDTILENINQLVRKFWQ